jgi:hypothetical protein
MVSLIIMVYLNYYKSFFILLLEHGKVLKLKVKIKRKFIPEEKFIQSQQNIALKIMVRSLKVTRL